MKTYKLIDDPLCDVEGFDSYENCEDCPYFYECMEVKEDDVQELLEQGYHFVNGEPVIPMELSNDAFLDYASYKFNEEEWQRLCNLLAE